MKFLGSRDCVQEESSRRLDNLSLNRKKRGGKLDDSMVFVGFELDADV